MNGVMSMLNRYMPLNGKKKNAKQNEDEFALNPTLAKIVAAAVIFTVGFAVGFIVEHSTGSSDIPDADAQNEGVVADAGESALIEELSEGESTPEQAPATKKKEAASKAEAAPKVESTPAPTAPQTTATPFGSLTAEEQADVKYLKSSDTWASSRVKSQRFKNMFAQLNSGNIDCLDAIFNGYEKDHVNGYAVNVISGIKKLSSEEREKAKKYLREDDKGEIKMSWAASQIGKMANN